MSYDDKTESDWRDRNWYVSIAGFWREFKKHRIGIIGLIVLAIFIGMAIGAPLLATHDPTPTSKVAPSYLAPSWMNVFDPGSAYTDEYIPDPALTQEPTYVANGTHGDEFTLVHHAPTSADDFGYLNMTWAHTPGPMSWREPYDPRGDLPESQDFLYFTQDIDWEFNRRPNDVNMTLEFGVTRTGNFSDPAGGIMFRIYVWIIDSSGNWRQVYKSYPPYVEDYQQRRIDLNYFDIVEGWGGMVEDENGDQEDPFNFLTVAVGIAPVRTFESWGGFLPEYNYTGSVTVTMKQLSMIAYGDYFGLLGTTDRGADAWSQLVYGSRVSLTIGILATLLSTAVGVVVGLVAGYFGGKIDEALMRVVDFLLVIPWLPLMMVLAAFLGPTIENIIVVIAILGWTGTSRLIRSQVMAERNKAYVESARAIGASDTYIMFKHILPNVAPILFANITLGVVGAILSESGLAFLGLTDPTVPSWGRMLSDAQRTGGFSNGAWWVVVFPGLMITVLSLAFTFVGHTLDQVLNPRLRAR